jgi:hypothetical protein
MKPLGIALGIALSVLFWFAPVEARADGAADAKAVIDKAIKAAGGADKLAKYPAIKRKGKGTFQVDTTLDPVEFTFESTLQGTDQVRLEYRPELATLMGRHVVVYNGDKGWGKEPDNDTTDLPQEGTAPFFKEHYRAVRLAELLTPLLSKDFKLAPLREIKVDKRTAVGVKISEKGHPDYDLYFDKETGLPIKGAFRLKLMKGDPLLQVPEIFHEFFFTGYKEVDGFQCLSKLSTRFNEKKWLDIEWIEIQPLEKVEKGTFDKP